MEELDVAQAVPEDTRKQVNGCRLGEFIGKGSVGSVYQAEDSVGDLVAIKVMEPTPFIDNRLLEAIVDGAKAVKSISKEAQIVEIIDSGKDGNCYFISMKFYPGGTLGKYIDEGSLSMKDKLKISLSLAKSLTYVHNAGIVHGDLKPSNVLMENLNPFLNDFYQASERLRKQNEVGAPQGTPQYMSPEQALGKFTNARSDIYSFGVLLYELFTGRSPYAKVAENVTSMVDVIQNSALIPPEKVNKKLDRKISAVIMKMLHREPTHRYPNMRQVANDLEACLKGKKVSVEVKGGLFSKIFG